MPVHTVMMDFHIQFNNTQQNDKLLKEQTMLVEEIRKILDKFIPNLKFIQTAELENGIASIYIGIKSSMITIRCMNPGLITINVEYFKEDSDEELLPFDKIQRLGYEIKVLVGSTRVKLYPPIKRGSAIDVYLTSSDERILEYDIDSVVFEKTSPYQKVQIVHSKSFGNLLILDDLQNLSERDLIYTETLMQRGKRDYKDKEIVILGGGDGGLLYELLKEKPKFVTMLELDEVVIQACRDHLRGCCFDVLDKYEGDNYKIILGDCVKSLNEMIANGTKVDYVFGDLTDIPVSTTPQGEVWDFIRLILNTSFQVLKSDGKYMTHGNGISSPASLKMFEEQLNNLNTPVEFSTDRAFVPSFLEDWVFYQVWAKK
uniref:Spermine synthase n=2 Tax=Cacopsylla melanoneura TaxID=428564 RepID=A0A8D9B9T3_9HEMI